MSSASEEEDSDDSDSRDLSSNVCNHCLSTSSKEWHQKDSTGKENTLLCNECKTFHKKFGELPKQLPQQIPTPSPAPTLTPTAPQTPQSLPSPTLQSTQFVFKSEDESITNGKHNMRTRRSKDKNNKDLNRCHFKSSQTDSEDRTDSIGRSDQKSPPICNFSDNSLKSEIKNNNELNPKKRIGSEITEFDETNIELTLNKRKKSTADEEGVQDSNTTESFITESNPLISDERTDLKENSEQSIGENLSPSESPVASLIETPNEDQEKTAEKSTTEISVNASQDSEPVVENESQDNKSNIIPIIETNLISNENKSIPNSYSEPKSPTDKYITPKLEPPSSPKSPPNFPVSALAVNSSEPLCPVPSNQKSSNGSTPPLVRIKEEINYPKSPPQTHTTQPIGPLISNSPLNERVFPYMGSQSLSAIPHRMTNSPTHQHLPTGMSSDSNKGKSRHSSDNAFGHKGSKDRMSSPKSSFSPSLTTISESSNIPIPSTSSITIAETSIFQSSYSTSTTPTEQRLPAVTSSAPHTSSHITNIHTSLSSSSLSPHLLPPSMPSMPSMPPYFQTSWSPYSSRCLPPHHLGFPASPFPPPMMGTGVQMPIQTNPRESVSKSKSPISSHSTRISHSPSQYTSASHHSKHDSKYDLSSVSNRDIDRHRDRDHSHRDPHEEEEIEPTPILSRGPSPEPKIEDSECHRSQSAM